MKYVRNWWRDVEVIQNAYSCVQGEGCKRKNVLLQRFVRNHLGKGDFSVQKVGLFFQS